MQLHLTSSVTVDALQCAFDLAVSAWLFITHFRITALERQQEKTKKEPAK